jgi:hypothetical protein
MRCQNPVVNLEIVGSLYDLLPRVMVKPSVAYQDTKAAERKKTLCG